MPTSLLFIQVCLPGRGCLRQRLRMSSSLTVTLGVCCTLGSQLTKPWNWTLAESCEDCRAILQGCVPGQFLQHLFGLMDPRILGCFCLLVTGCVPKAGNGTFSEKFLSCLLKTVLKLTGKVHLIQLSDCAFSTFTAIFRSSVRKARVILSWTH